MTDQEKSPEYYRIKTAEGPATNIVPRVVAMLLAAVDGGQSLPPMELHFDVSGMSDWRQDEFRTSLERMAGQSGKWRDD